MFLITIQSALLHKVMLRKHFSNKMEGFFSPSFSLPSHNGVRCRHAVPKPVFHFCLPICQVFRGGNLGWRSLKAVACPCKSAIWTDKDWDHRAAGCRSAPSRQIANNVRVVPPTFRWCTVFSNTLVLRLISISAII